MKTGQKEIKIWEGVYKNFKETGVKNDVFNEEAWVSNSLKKLEKIVRDRSGNYSENLNQDALLPLLTASILSTNKKPTVLDFGGGLGISYAQILKSVGKAENVKFFIVEKEAVCKAGSKFFKNNKQVIFLNSLPKIKKIDLIHLRSSLQYMEDWKNVLAKLVEYKPSFFLFIDLFAGNVPTYVTLQNYYGKKIPCQFLNINDVIKEMKKNGFEVLYKAPFPSTFFCKLSDFPQSNLPTKYRVKNSYNILFFNKNN